MLGSLRKLDQDEVQKEIEVSQRSSSPNAQQLLQLNDANLEAIPSYPFVLKFTNLTYSIKICRKPTYSPVCRDATKNECEEKVLLNGISGVVKEGQVMGVMGASGSGKSTLLDALAGQVSKDSLKGSVTLNGHELLGLSTSNFLKSTSAYVMQNDLLFPMLTVEETLMFSAELRLPRTLSKSKKRQRVQELIYQLGLQDAAKTMIGDEGHNGVSGGERKRVSIGVGIIHGPSILFLDEPTSGLDSTSAFLVVSVLQGIAHSGSMVILSIHQPSSRILCLMDHLIILSYGQMVYSGSTSNLTQFFAAFNHPIPEDENKAEFALDLISELEKSPEGIVSLVELNKSWQMTENQQDYSGISKVMSLEVEGAVNAWISNGMLLTKGAFMFPASANPFWVETYIIAKRSCINSTRRPQSFCFRFGAVLLSSLMLATIFWRLDDTPKGAEERLGFFASAMNISFFTCAEAIPYFIQEKHIFIRETAYNTYKRSSYVLSHLIIALPSLILFSLTFSTITFWAVGLEGGLSGFLWFFLFMFASFWVGHSFVTFLSAVVPHVMIGYMMVVTLLAQFTLFSGFFIPRDQIPPYWQWFHYISLVKYPYQGVMLNEFNDNPVKCLVNGIQVFDNTPFKDTPEASRAKVLESVGRTLGINMTSFCVMTSSNVLQRQGVTDLSKLNCFWITIAWGFFFRILFYLLCC